MMIMHLIIWSLSLGSGTDSVVGQAALNESVRARYVMGTRCTIRVFHGSEERGLEAIEAAFETIASLEDVLSTWRPESELSKVNGLASELPVALSPDLAHFVQKSLDLAAATDGAFDPTVGPLLQVWKVRESGAIPSVEDLKLARGLVGHQRVRLNSSEGTLSFDLEGMWLEAGALGKGMALDAAAVELKSHGVSAALLDFGGQLLAIGHPPGQRAWRIAVAHPLDRSLPAMELHLVDASVATSSQGERANVVAGRSIGHVMDPRTGEPVDRLGSVSVVASDAATADALSTALLVMGPEEGLAWLERQAAVSAAWLSPNEHGALRLLSDSSFPRTGELLASSR